MTYTRPSHFRVGESGFHPTHDVWRQTYERLAWVYGPARAQEKIMGRDAQTQADVAAWRALGGGQ